MSNIYYLSGHCRKPMPQRMGKYDRLQKQLLRRAEIRDSESRAAFDSLTDLLVMEQAKAGLLNPTILELLLAAARQQPVGEGGR